MMVSALAILLHPTISTGKHHMFMEHGSLNQFGQATYVKENVIACYFPY